MTKKLTDRQQELLDAMRKGVVCHYMPYMGSFRPNAYYFRTDTHASCTAQVKALLKRGVVEMFDMTWQGHKVRAIGDHSPAATTTKETANGLQ